MALENESEKEDIEGLKNRLRSYREADIQFNEPHFSQQLALREGSRGEVIRRVLHPESLVFSFTQRARLGETIHKLHFNISNTRTMILPVILDPRGKKGIYILTYIMRYRRWQNMVRRGARNE